MGAVRKDIIFNCGVGAQILLLAESFVPNEAGSSNSPNWPRRTVSRLTALMPGVVLCVLISLVALGAQSLEARAFAHPYVEALVIAILIGAAVRTIWNPPERWWCGIAFSAKQLLEVAINHATSLAEATKLMQNFLDQAVVQQPPGAGK